MGVAKKEGGKGERTISSSGIGKSEVMSNFLKRCEVCLTMEGGHFEYAQERFE